MSRLVCRDPFGREELHAKRIHDPSSSQRECKNCGHIRETPSGIRWLYQFWIERDDQMGRKHEDQYLFCCHECRSDYFHIDKQSQF